jgi:ketosteroid isomerase-like protein
MKRSNVVLVLACAALIACAQGMTQREEALARQVVRDQVSAWVRAMNNARKDSIATFYHQVPGLRVLWADGRRTDGWEAAEEKIRTFYAGINYMNFVATEVEVQVLSPQAALALFSHSIDIVQRNGQRLPVQSGQASLLWVKDQQDNRWKISMSHVATSAPAMN